MKNTSIVILCLIAVCLGEIRREFIFVSDSPTNRIALANVIIEPNSVTVACEGDGDCEIGNWRFSGENNIIFFAGEIEANQKIRVEYTELFPGILRVYGLNLPVFTPQNELNESDFSTQISPFRGTLPELNFDGSKTVGVSLGSNGELAVEQSLRVEIYGIIDEDTRISAFIDDQSSSLDGQTSEIGELDRIFMKVENPGWSAIVGDLELRSPPDGILSEFYTPKGIFLELKNDEIGRQNSVFAGISGTNSAYMRFEPSAGLQGGIYNLTGRDGSHVFLVPGSVVVLIDGRPQRANENYTVDYHLSSVRFTAQTPIRSGQTVEIHYRYRSFEYNSFLTGTQNRFSFLDSALNVDISFFLDRDIFESSQRNFTQDEIEAIRNSTDASPLLRLGNKIHRNDVLRVQAFERIYSLDENGIFHWVFNPEDLYLTQDLFTVKFRRTESGAGDYAPYFSFERDRFLALGYSAQFLDEVQNAASAVLDFIYLYVGAGNGNYSAFGEVALPSQSVKGEISVNYAPSEQLRMNIAASGENFDSNTLSRFDDRNNNSSAFRTDLFVSSDPENNFIVKNDFTAAAAGDLFVNRMLNSYELSRNWGIADSLTYSLWENIFRMGFQRNILLVGGYGRANYGVSESVRRFSAGFESGAQTPFDFSYLYTARTASSSAVAGSGRIQNAQIGFNLGDNRLNVFAREDWHLSESLQYYDGRIEARISHGNELRGFSNSFTYKEIGASAQNSHFSRTRTLHSLAFSSALTANISSNRNFQSAASIIYEETQSGATSIFLLSLSDRFLSSDRLFGVNTSWDLSSESRNERRWEYIRVPAGTGTHVRDPIFGGFIEAQFGDYVAREAVISGGGADALEFFVRNNFSLDWHAATRNGLRFSGILLNESDVRDERGGENAASRWLIFLPFASNISEELRSKASYSLLSYRQDFSVMPPQTPLRANVRLTASIGADALRNRRLLEEETSFLYAWDRFHLGFSNRGFVEETRGAGNLRLLVRDINFKPLQNFVINDWLNIFLEETLGLIHKNASGNYSAARGGFRFLPTQAGSAEISYTYAYVNFNDELRHNMADGFALNGNHRISANLGIRASDFLRFSGFVRGDRNRDTSGNWRFFASVNAEIAIN